MDEEKLRDGDRSAVEGARGLLGLSGIGEGGTRVPPTFEFHPRRASSIPQHICVVTETYSPEINGVALTLAHLVNGLRARQHKVSVVYPESAEEDDVRRERARLPSRGCSGSRSALARLPRITIRIARGTSFAALVEKSASCCGVCSNSRAVGLVGGSRG